MNSKIHPAYLAGVIDSDGSLTISKQHPKRPNPYYACCFQLTWRETPLALEFMLKLKNQYGGSFFYQKVKPEQHYPNSKPTIKYMLTGRNIEPLINDVLPYLELKKQQATNILEIRCITEYGKYGSRRPKPEEVKQKQNQIWLNSRFLNTKNSGNRSKDEHHFE